MWRRLPWLLLLAAAFCFGAGYLASRYAQTPGVVRRTDLLHLRQLVRTAETSARREADTIAAQLPRGNFSFQKLLAETTYPTCVLENGILRYWSDATLRPEAEASGSVAERLVETPVGHFLLLRRAVGTFTILTYVPLERHYGISNRYLRAGGEQALFRGLELKVVADSTAPGRASFEAADGHYLFSIRRLQPNLLAGQYVPLALLGLGVLLYAAAWLLLAGRWWRARRAGRAVAILVLPLVGLRVGLLYLGLPYSFIELPLFDPRVYAASWWAPSLGDLLLNALLVLLIAAGGALLWRRADVPARVRAPRPLLSQALAAGGIGAIFCGWLGLLFVYYTTVFSSSQSSLDVRNLQVTGFWALLVLAVLLHTAAWLIGFFGLTQLAGALLKYVPRRALLLGPGLVALPVLGVGLALGLPWVLLAGVLLLFASLVRAVDLQPAPSMGSYQTLVLLVLLLALSSATGALALYAHFEKQLLIDKQRLAGNLLVDNDFQGEYLLGVQMRKIAADPFVRQSLSAVFGRSEVVRQRIARQYLGEYFDKYESEITLYDASGDPLGAVPGTPTLMMSRAEMARIATPTDQGGVYLVHSGNPFSSRRYVAHITVPGTRVNGFGPALGGVRIELTLKKLTAYSVLPELLVDQKFFQSGLTTELSYAGYNHGRLVYSEGSFDYANHLPTVLLTEPRLYGDGLSREGYHHFAVRGSQGRTVVVSTATYSPSDWLANFSFQFLVSAFFWLVVGGLGLLLRGRSSPQLRLNFSARIQLLLNVGIVVPLLVVSVATASQLIASYKRDLMRTYERRGQLALESLRRQRHLLADSSARPTLAALAKNVAGLTETDLNLYDAHGELLASSQPLIFDAGLLGPLLNPQAVVALREHNQQRALLTERAGSLSFNSLYLPVRAGVGEVVVADLAGHALNHGREPAPRRGAPKSAAPPRIVDDAATTDDTALPTGPILGYVGIPFFDSEKELNTKLTELFMTILNIFTLMFLLFLGLAFIAARQLTAPLKLITEKLTQTTLTGENELLDYRSSDDEIGLLVREYNTMLTKLEASKRELAAQEKEAAWREMARQVAHEIKNPLTPMKLSLQFLQKAIAERRANAEELISRIAQTLITQIDVLSDIATSFSTFTNLPAMRPERLDVVAILRRCAALHQPDDADGTLELHLPAAEAEAAHFIVYADESLLVRTFNNLLINARQAVPAGREPHVLVALEAGAGSVKVTIRDNGAGISEAVREQIFVPNFTTKVSGSGIGLAVARRGIESAGGRLWFETVVGEGTAFFIELPLAG